MNFKTLIFASALLLVNLFAGAQTNDFYDDAETIKLQPTQIELAGEVANPGMINTTDLPIRSVIVKETLLVDRKDKFIGAYRYDGYSLYDLLNKAVLKKKNETEFPPIVDLYVLVENKAGEKVVFSWGELFYPIHRHEIIVANQVARIVPSKTKDLWPLPSESRLVVASDLLTHRNISMPTRITVCSYSGKYLIQKGLSPMNSREFTLSETGVTLATVSQLPTTVNKVTYPAVFYGRGRGIHGTTPFTGIMLKDFLKNYISINDKSLKNKILVVAGKDGYHAVFTVSELMNRNDQAEFLLTADPQVEDGGVFMVYPAADFFSDRAIKSVESMRIVEIPE
jgi:hypothetical protein